MNDITPKEAIANLNHLYGMVAPDMQRSLDVAIKFMEERPQGDCISRSALKEAINSSIAEATKIGIMVDAGYLWELLNYAIDNAPTVDIKDQIAGAYNEGYTCGNKEAEKARPQGKYVDISKLRLMTVEECAGHTIDYAMGWKACIEWIKKGGAE